ncbi:hypothetical protein EXIGLDRAFT_846384 [Exidia glandulosa HHB12029]|uniref:Uncharacterized protein n=1 Tax=Exidia glandulosa HHB12029 TaxID=1314781 RepID=A0A165B046_EXIGL|nr:hypothetical protein EXIGLDRAFT_846384 [Exidia glandulosa HHB12029]
MSAPTPTVTLNPNSGTSSSNTTRTTSATVPSDFFSSPPSASFTFDLAKPTGLPASSPFVFGATSSNAPISALPFAILSTQADTPASVTPRAPASSLRAPSALGRRPALPSTPLAVSGTALSSAAALPFEFPIVPPTSTLPTSPALSVDVPSTSSTPQAQSPATDTSDSGVPPLSSVPPPRSSAQTSLWTGAPISSLPFAIDPLSTTNLNYTTTPALSVPLANSLTPNTPAQSLFTPLSVPSLSSFDAPPPPTSNSSPASTASIDANTPASTLPRVVFAFDSHTVCSTLLDAQKAAFAAEEARRLEAEACCAALEARHAVSLRAEKEKSTNLEAELVRKRAEVNREILAAQNMEARRQAEILQLKQELEGLRAALGKEQKAHGDAETQKHVWKDKYTVSQQTLSGTRDENVRLAQELSNARADYRKLSAKSKRDSLSAQAENSLQRSELEELRRKLREMEAAETRRRDEERRAQRERREREERARASAGRWDAREKMRGQPSDPQPQAGPSRAPPPRPPPQQPALPPSPPLNSTPLQQYEHYWSQITTFDDTKSWRFTFELFPFPTTVPRQITNDTVGKFFGLRAGADAAKGKRTVHDEQKRWHSDKFVPLGRLNCVVEADREKVEQTAKAVSVCLNFWLENLSNKPAPDMS